MNNYIKHLFFIGIVLFTTSCVSQKTATTYTYQPEKVLKIEMSDMTYLGNVTIEVEYKTYGLITKIYTVNGTAYDPRFYSETKLVSASSNYSKYLNKAMYKVQEVYPEAEYILPVVEKKQIEYMNGGRIIKETMVVRAYKLK